MITLLVAVTLAPAQTRVSQQSSAKQSTPADVRRTISACLLTLALRTHVKDTPLNMGTKAKPQRLVLVETRGLLLHATPVPGYDPESCKGAEVSKADEDLPPLYFAPGKQSVLRFPSRIEAVLTVIPGFAYYGIPNQVVTEYRRTLP